MVVQARRLLEYRTICTNIDAALDLMSKCSYVLNLAIKAQDQIDNSKYLVALKVALPVLAECCAQWCAQTIDQLQRIHLPRFPNYAFAKAIG